ncbi:MAG: hypothetical protein ACSHYB_13285 [Roseibacillus sp.]
MNENADSIYQAPQADLLESPQGEIVEHCYLVSRKKFWILFLATMGTYQLYWFYRHWQIYRTNTSENLWPVARSLFSIFFVHKLFETFESRARLSGDSRVGLSVIATFFVLVSIADRVATRLIDEVEFNWLLQIGYWMPLPIIGWFLWKAQSVANLSSGEGFGESNGTLTFANWTWIAIGLVLWASTIHDYLLFFEVVPALF